MSVVLQPAADPAARRHFALTVDPPVNLATVGHLLERSDLDRLLELFPAGQVALWGLTRGKNDHNVSRYQRMAAGDPVLFFRSGAVFCTGVVAHTFRNAALAEQLWAPKDGQPFELMYAIADPLPATIPMAQVAELADFKLPVLSFRVLSQPASDALTEGLALPTQVVPQPVPAELLEQAFAHPFTGAVDDIPTIVRRRAEQATINRRLLPGPRHSCALCGNEYPRRLLVAAHIKRRADCSPEERRDVDNNVIRACRLGCDELFERGDIYVSPQGLIQTRLAPQDGFVFDHVQSALVGRSVAGFSPAAAAYYAAHHARTAG